jgi:23S rRNA pseudouridine2605 synthase
MTTLQDPHAERIVADYFQDVLVRLFPVGRLDRDTTGLLLMTNDGELAFRLTHPKFGVEKKYRAKVKGFVTDEEARTIEKGVDLEEGTTAPCVVTIESRNKRETLLVVVLHEGKKRQIRRIFDGIGHRVIELERFQYGTLSLGDMRSGQKRRLTAEEVHALKIVTGLVPSKKSHAPKNG